MIQQRFKLLLLFIFSCAFITFEKMESADQAVAEVRIIILR